jgi:hypothetical protein
VVGYRTLHPGTTRPGSRRGPSSARGGAVRQKCGSAEVRKCGTASGDDLRDPAEAPRVARAVETAATTTRSPPSRTTGWRTADAMQRETSSDAAEARRGMPRRYDRWTRTPAHRSRTAHLASAGHEDVPLPLFGRGTGAKRQG